MTRIATAAMLVLGLALHAHGQFEPADPRSGPRRPDRPLLPPEEAPPPAAPKKPATKVDPPSAQEVDEARAIIRDVFKKELSSAKSPAQHADVARLLLEKARSSQGDSAGYFVLLEEAGTLGAKGGDVVTTFTAIDELSSVFKVNDLKMRRDALVTLGSNLPPPAHKQIADLALGLIDRAVEADDFPVAKELVKIGAGSARKAKDANAAKIANARSVEIDKLSKQYAAVKGAFEKLEAAPGDAEANLQAGTFLCFSKGDWSRGLPMLAQGSDGALKSLAERDLAKPTDPTAQIALGDAWWDLAEKQDGIAKGQLQMRASEWYQKAVPKAAGLAKAKAEKRVADVANELAKSGTAAPALPLFAKAQTAVRKRHLNRIGPLGYSSENPWEDIPEEGGVLIGLDVGLSFRGDRIQAIQAVYATSRGEVRGKPFGMPTPKVVNLRAKPGFAIGVITANAGWTLEGLSVTYMKMAGDRLDLKDSSNSDYIGGGQANTDDLSSGGEPIVGLHGKISRDGRLTTIGVITPMDEAIASGLPGD